jgi:hypothetical protein
MDAALDRVGALIDKLRKASATTNGIGLVWTPTDSLRSCTFTVLAGEITGLPIAHHGDGLSWVLRRPIVSIDVDVPAVLARHRDAHVDELELDAVQRFRDRQRHGRHPGARPADHHGHGDAVPPPCRVGLEGPLTYNSATSLLIDSDNMVVTGLLGRAGGHDGRVRPERLRQQLDHPHADRRARRRRWRDGRSALPCRRVPREGARPVRVAAEPVPAVVEGGDGPTNHNTWATPISTAGWQELDLGTITIPAATLGTQRWTGQVEVQGAATSPGTVALDYLILVPQADGYGKARAQWSLGTGVLVAQDAFTGTTSGSALSTRTAPLGGSWATSGDATDLSSPTTSFQAMASKDSLGPRSALRPRADSPFSAQRPTRIRRSTAGS